MPNNLRICFQNDCSVNWIAGCYYLKNLFTALRMQEPTPEIVLLGRTPLSDEILTVDQQITAPPARWPLPERLLQRIPRQLDRNITRAARLRTLLHQHRIAAAFVTYDFTMALDVPRLCWIPDFQHVHLPEMFTTQEINQRNAKFRQAAHAASLVLLSSEAARRDFAQFAPDLAHKGRVLSFVSWIPETVYERDPGWISPRYHLPERFFLLPNQFFKHKNHQVVIDALVQLKNTHPEIIVVCTGYTHDYRSPNYFPELLARISQAAVRDQLIILGLVPRDEVFPLMRQALAVLQPSFFEGWNTAVEEAKSLGKRMIISDLPVHCEQNPPASLYFDPNDPTALADCLVKVYNEIQPGPDRALEAQARAVMMPRMRAYGETFMEIVREAVRASSASTA